MKKSVSVLTLVLVALVGCAAEPQKQLTNAQEAVENARQAEADLYAAAEYQAAVESLGAARDAISAQEEEFVFIRSYAQAEELLTQAEKQARASQEVAVGNRERIRQQAERAQTAAQVALEAARAVLDGAPRGKGTLMDLQLLRQDFVAGESTLVAARQALEAGAFMNALKQFESVKSESELISAEVEQAMKRRGYR